MDLVPLDGPSDALPLLLGPLGAFPPLDVSVVPCAFLACALPALVVVVGGIGLAVGMLDVINDESGKG